MGPTRQRLWSAGLTTQTDAARSGAIADRWPIADLGADSSLSTPLFPPATATPPSPTSGGADRPLGFRCRRVVVPQRCGSRAGRPGPGRDQSDRGAPHRQPVCSLYFHVDTVPPGDGWTVPPLALTRSGDKLYRPRRRRHEGPIASTAGAARGPARDIALRFEPVLLFCTDEEGGLYPGIRYLAEQNLEGHILNFNGGAAPRIWAGCFGSIDIADPRAGPRRAIPAIARPRHQRARIDPAAERAPRPQGAGGAARFQMPAPPHFDGAAAAR